MLQSVRSTRQLRLLRQHALGQISHPSWAGLTAKTSWPSTPPEPQSHVAAGMALPPAAKGLSAVTAMSPSASKVFLGTRADLPAGHITLKLFACCCTRGAQIPRRSGRSRKHAGCLLYP